VKVNGAYHEPVLVEESIEGLAVKQGGVYLDCTLGDGGHFTEIISALGQAGTAVGIDTDPESVSWVKNRVRHPSVNVIIEQCRFSRLDEVCDRHKLGALDGVLMDLGVSSRQIDSPDRGFSYLGDSTLDMRMDPSCGVPAHALLKNLSEHGLAEVLRSYGEVRNAGRMAATITQYMKRHELTTSADLKACLAREYGTLGMKLLSKLYQALRIAVNGELDELEEGLEKAARRLRRGGRLVVISYHSLEDRIVKNFIRANASPGSQPFSALQQGEKEIHFKLKRINKKVICPSQAEIASNNRSRSAKMRIAEKAG
jgi:16S rRNA (cytosine1402-N4)-methyltransferase